MSSIQPETPLFHYEYEDPDALECGFCYGRFPKNMMGAITYSNFFGTYTYRLRPMMCEHCVPKYTKALKAISFTWRGKGINLDLGYYAFTFNVPRTMFGAKKVYQQFINDWPAMCTQMKLMEE